MPIYDPNNPSMNSNRTNGNSDHAWQNRMADLLDDVTVNDAAATTADAHEQYAPPPSATTAPPPPPMRTAPPASTITPPPPTTYPSNNDEDLPPFLKAVPPAAAISNGFTNTQTAPQNGSANNAHAATETPPGADYSALFMPVEQTPPVEQLPPAEQISPVEQTPEPTYLQPPQPAVSIKGRTDGLAIEIGKGSWQEVMALLAERLEQSASFFRNAKVALDVGPRSVVEDELRQLIALLSRYGMVLSAVRTGSERTFQAALGMSLTATLESADGAPVADATPAAVSSGTAGYFIYRGYLRSGHRLQRKEHILVIGDVNPGAEVTSSGDVLVWGRLRGIAHAGFDGNRRSIIAALDLEATQLRIADVVTIGPDPKLGQPGKWFWKRNVHKRPEVARVVNESIIVDEWDMARPGGLASLRRGGV